MTELHQIAVPWPAIVRLWSADRNLARLGRDHVHSKGRGANGASLASYSGDTP